MRKRQVFEHNTKSLMNLRPPNYMNLRPQTKIVNPRLQKSCECIWRGGAAPSPPTPLQLFFLGLPPLQGQPAPTWNVSTSNWNHRKKINSQNISAPFIIQPVFFNQNWKSAQVHRARICFSLRRGRWFALREWCLSTGHGMNRDIWHEMIVCSKVRGNMHRKYCKNSFGEKYRHY